MATPSEDQVLLGDNLEILPAFDDGSFQLVYADPPFNTGRRQRRLTLATDAWPTATATASAGAATRPASSASPRSPTPSTTTSASSSRASRELRRRPGPARDALSPPRLPRGALRQGAARRALRPRVLPERDRLGLRLRRPRPERRWPAKHDTILVYVRDPDALLVRRRGGRARALHGAGPGDRRRRPRAGSCRRTSGGTRSSRRPARRRPATRPRSRRGSCGGWCRPPSRPGDWCLDPFAGSGTLGAVCARPRPPLRARRLEPGGGRGRPKAPRAVSQRGARGTCRGRTEIPGSCRQALDFGRSARLRHQRV